MPHGLHPGAYSGWHSRQPLELNQPADVVTEVHHPDLKPRPRDADGAHDLAAHRVLLVAEYVVVTRCHYLPRARAYAREYRERRPPDRRRSLEQGMTGSGVTGVTALRPRRRRGRSLRRSRALNLRFQVQAVEPPIHALQIDRGAVLWSPSP